MLYIASQTQIQFISSKPSHHTSIVTVLQLNANIPVSETLWQRLYIYVVPVFALHN